jgi:hypothetical protein
MAALINDILLFLIVSADMEGLPIFTHSFIAELLKQAIKRPVSHLVKRILTTAVSVLQAINEN